MAQACNPSIQKESAATDPLQVPLAKNLNGYSQPGEGIAASLRHGPVMADSNHCCQIGAPAIAQKAKKSPSNVGLLKAPEGAKEENYLMQHYLSMGFR